MCRVGKIIRNSYTFPQFASGDMVRIWQKETEVLVLVCFCQFFFFFVTNS